MPNVGPMEILLLAVLALLLFGPKKLPEIGRSVGKGMREFKESVSGHTEEIRSALEVDPDEDEQDEPDTVDYLEHDQT